MSVETNKAVIRDLLEGVNGATAHGGTLDAHPGMADMQPFIAMMSAAFADIHCEVKELLGEGDWVACRTIWRGTHRGEFMGIPATGRTVEWEVILTYRFADGKIVEHHGQGDTLGQLQQLGTQPATVGV